MTAWIEPHASSGEQARHRLLSAVALSVGVHFTLLYTVPVGYGTGAASMASAMPLRVALHTEVEAPRPPAVQAQPLAPNSDDSSVAMAKQPETPAPQEAAPVAAAAS